MRRPGLDEVGEAEGHVAERHQDVGADDVVSGALQHREQQLREGPKGSTHGTAGCRHIIDCSETVNDGSNLGGDVAWKKEH